MTSLLKFTCTGILALSWSALTMISSAEAGPAERYSVDVNRSMKVTQVSNQAPLGYQLYCLQNPKDCRATKNSQVAADTRVLGILRRVNDSVNRSIKPKADRPGLDNWTAGRGSGDCEDYALEKRRRLIRAGIPAGALRIAVVRTKQGEGHAVLVVKTSTGELVLDNLRSRIVHRNSAGYRWIKMAGADPSVWTRL